jgi:hypothetical protein
MITNAKLLLLAIAVYPFFAGPAGATSATCTVPAVATGSFGKPTTSGGAGMPLVPCITVSTPGTIIITAQGSWSYRDNETNGPNGECNTAAGFQLPLQEAVGTAPPTSCSAGALIGAFVPASIVQSSGFNAVDGTKNRSLIGITPNSLFFVGEYTAFEANGPGTLFLGINDGTPDDNSGQLTVQIQGP